MADYGIRKVMKTVEKCRAGEQFRPTEYREGSYLSR